MKSKIDSFPKIKSALELDSPEEPVELLEVLVEAASSSNPRLVQVRLQPADKISTLEYLFLRSNHS